MACSKMAPNGWLRDLWLEPSEGDNVTNDGPKGEAVGRVNLKFGNRVAMTFCATHQCARTCPSYPRQRAVKKARSPEARALPGLWSVWADAHGFEVAVAVAVAVAVEVEFEVKGRSHAPPACNPLIFLKSPSLYIPLHADTNHSRTAAIHMPIILSPAPQWGGHLN